MAVEKVRGATTEVEPRMEGGEMGAVDSVAAPHEAGRGGAAAGKATEGAAAA